MGVIGLFPTSPPALLDASHVVVDKVLWRRGPRHLHCATPSHEKLLSPMIRSCTSCAHTTQFPTKASGNCILTALRYSTPDSGCLDVVIWVGELASDRERGQGRALGDARMQDNNTHQAVPINEICDFRWSRNKPMPA